LNFNIWVWPVKVADNNIMSRTFVAYLYLISNPITFSCFEQECQSRFVLFIYS
jgi:hypothetical protein